MCANDRFQRESNNLCSRTYQTEAHRNMLLKQQVLDLQTPITRWGQYTSYNSISTGQSRDCNYLCFGTLDGVI